MPGPNSPYTKLDQQQIIQQVYDESTDRLRVDAEITASVGDVHIDGTGPDASSIQITDGTDTLQINPDGSIDANVEVDAADGDNIMAVGTEDGTFSGTQHPIKVDAAGNQYVVATDAPVNETQFITFDSVTSVASGVATNILVYTVPPLTSIYLSRVMVSGTNIAAYTIYFDATIVAKRRTDLSGGLNDNFEFGQSNRSGYRVDSGTTITIEVLHNRPDLGDFEATLLGILKT